MYPEEHLNSIPYRLGLSCRCGYFVLVVHLTIIVVSDKKTSLITGYFTCLFSSVVSAIS